MLKFLISKCIKDHDSTSNETVRAKYGVFAGVLGIISNAALVAVKVIIGLLAGSVSVIGDAVNNLSDMGSSVVTLWGFKISSRPADSEHPYGHARYEYITGLIVAVIILVIGVLLGKNGVEKIINPTEISYKWYTFVLLGVSVLIKLWQMFSYKYIAKTINSKALNATASDSLFDVITTLVVMICALINYFFKNVSLDGYAAVFVAVFIVVCSLRLIKEMADPLVGQRPSKELVSAITEKIKSYEPVLGFHDLMIHNYGPDIVYASMHVELSSDMSLFDAHDLLDNIEFEFLKDMNVHMVLHPDPVDTKDELTAELKRQVSDILSNIEGVESIHDFRLVKGKNHVNVVFDVIIKYGYNIKSSELEYILSKEIKDTTQYHYHINCDRRFS